jgi:hypothetical protein
MQMNILLFLLGIDRNTGLRVDRRGHRLFTIALRPQRPAQAREFVRLEAIRALPPLRYPCRPAPVLKTSLRSISIRPKSMPRAPKPIFLAGH